MEFLLTLPMGARAGPPGGVVIVGIATDDCKWIARDSENWTGLHPGHDWCFPNRQTFSGRQEEIPGTYSWTPCLCPCLWTPPIASDLGPAHHAHGRTSRFLLECRTSTDYQVVDLARRRCVPGDDGHGRLMVSMMRVHGVCVNLNDSKLADKCILYTCR